MSGLSNTGFTPKTLSEIEDAKNNLLIFKLGTAVNLSSESIIGILRDIESDEDSELWLELQKIYNALQVTAEGDPLDNILEVAGTKRIASKASKMSKFKLYFTGDQVVSAGETFSNTANTLSYTLDEEVDHTYSGSGTDEVEVKITCTETGVVSYAENSITEFSSSLTNLSAVNNDSNTVFFQGINQELDWEATQRLQSLKSVVKSSTESGMAVAVLAINDGTIGFPAIQNCLVKSNKTLYPDSAGRPAKSTEAVVFYGTGTDTALDDYICQILAETASDSTQFVSTTTASYSKTVTVDGQSRDIEFSRPDEINIYLTITELETEGEDLTSEQETALKDALVAWGNNLGLGADVISNGRDSISNVLNTFTGAKITDYKIKVGKTILPSTDDNVTIAYNEVSVWDATRINL